MARYIGYNYDYLEEVTTGSHEVCAVFCLNFGFGCERFENLCEMHVDDVSVSQYPKVSQVLSNCRNAASRCFCKRWHCCVNCV